MEKNRARDRESHNEVYRLVLHSVTLNACKGEPLFEAEYLENDARLGHR